MCRSLAGFPGQRINPSPILTKEATKKLARCPAFVGFFTHSSTSPSLQRVDEVCRE